MPSNTARSALLGAVTLAVLIATAAQARSEAAPPNLRTPGPVIHLADNLDTADRLGWCNDTVGHGFSTEPHAHSCKPQGCDVEFTDGREAQEIRSAFSRDDCATIVGSGATDLGLAICDEADPEPRFTFGSSRLSPAGVPGLCDISKTGSG